MYHHVCAAFHVCFCFCFSMHFSLRFDGWMDLMMRLGKDCVFLCQVWLAMISFCIYLYGLVYWAGRKAISMLDGKTTLGVGIYWNLVGDLLRQVVCFCFMFGLV